MDFTDIESTLNTLNNSHFLPGPLYQRINRYNASKVLETNELLAIYHLVESHAPGLRQKTIFRHSKANLLNPSCNDNAKPQTNYINFNCVSQSNEHNVTEMLERLKEMPKEWSVVQLTPEFNSADNLFVSSNEFSTNPLHLAVFSCGPNATPPFTVRIEAPIDPVDYTPVKLMDEIHEIITANNDWLDSWKHKKFFSNSSEKSSYLKSRYKIGDRLHMLINDLEKLWLRQWRCLLLGKCIDESIESLLNQKITEFAKQESTEISDKSLSILRNFAKAYTFLSITEQKLILHEVLLTNDRSVLKNWGKLIRDLNRELALNTQKRYPVILIVDDTLDAFPWEMIDIFQMQPVSRLPSLHFLYALYISHKDTIVNGYKEIKSYENGSYILNPKGDLKAMEIRLRSFLQYWTPKWKGLVCVEPKENEFQEMLTSSAIFCYNGHGNGTHYFAMEKIQKIHMNAVVLLFGCSSTKSISIGPKAEMIGAYQMYLIANSPCIVGMLWPVTDLDTDILSTEFISRWIPSKAKIPWQRIEIGDWMKGTVTNINTLRLKQEKCETVHSEPDLLRAIAIAKNSSIVQFFLNKAACVVRGIPVKVV